MSLMFSSIILLVGDIFLVVLFYNTTSEERCEIILFGLEQELANILYSVILYKLQASLLNRV